MENSPKFENLQQPGIVSTPENQALAKTTELLRQKVEEAKVYSSNPENVGDQPGTGGKFDQLRTEIERLRAQIDILDPELREQDQDTRDQPRTSTIRRIMGVGQRLKSVLKKGIEEARDSQPNSTQLLTDQEHKPKAVFRIEEESDPRAVEENLVLPTEEFRKLKGVFKLHDLKWRDWWEYDLEELNTALSIFKTWGKKFPGNEELEVYIKEVQNLIEDAEHNELGVPQDTSFSFDDSVSKIRTPGDTSLKGPEKDVGISNSAQESWLEEDERILQGLIEQIAKNRAIIEESQARIAEINARLKELDEENEGNKIEKVKESGASSLPKKHPETGVEEAVNQDSYFALDGLAYGVFDGVGGSVGGKVASNMAKDIIEKAILDAPKDISLESFQKDYLVPSIEKANDAIIQDSRDDPPGKERATTASIIRFGTTPEDKDKAVIANFGDSRIYALMEDGKFEQITLDDGLGINQARQEKFSNATSETDLSTEELGLWNQRNVVFQVLGRSDTKIHSEIISLEGVRKLLICSDGVSDILINGKISSIMNANEPASATASRLTETARKENYGFRQKEYGDDMTAIVINIQ